MESADTQNKEQSTQGSTIIINQEVRKTNGIGIAGFVLALLGILLGWIPVLGWVIWVLGLIFSIIGMFRSPRGLAIAGFIISIIDIILLLTVFAGIIAAMAL